MFFIIGIAPLLFYPRVALLNYVAAPRPVVLYPYLSCDIHTHTPARNSTSFQLYHFVIQNGYTNCLGHGHGYEYHSPLPARFRLKSNAASVPCATCQVSIFTRCRSAPSRALPVVLAAVAVVVLVVVVGNVVRSQ